MNLAGVKYKLAVTVKPMVLDYTSFNLAPGSKISITSLYKPVDADWKSSNKKVASVTKDGLIQALSAGTATISAKISGKKYNVKVKVEKTWDPYKKDRATYYITPGEKIQITTYGKKFKANWKSTNTSVATVNKNGVITGHKTGFACMEAIVGGYCYQAPVWVMEFDPYLFMPYFSKSASGKTTFAYNLLTYDKTTKTYKTSSGTEPYNVIVYNSSKARRFDGDAMLEISSWKSSDPSVLSVKKKSDVAAEITFKKTGTATISVVCRKKTYKFRVEVENKEGDTLELVQEIYKAAGVSKSMKPQYQLFLLAKWECEHLSYGFVEEQNGTGAYSSKNEAFDYLKAVTEGRI